MKAGPIAKAGTVYPNPPLREAAFEVRFNPLLKIERDLSNFQEKIAQQYPVLGKESLLINSEQVQSSLFRTQDTKNVLRVSIMSFGVSTLAYRGFVPFKKEVLEKTRLFCKCFEIETFKRVGLRYINNIEIPQHGDWFNFAEFVRPLLDVQLVPAQEIRRFALEVALRKSLGQLTIRSGLIPIPTQSQSDIGRAAFVLDLDFDTEELTNLAKLSSLLDGFHAEVENAFLAQITESMIARMKEPRQ